MAAGGVTPPRADQQMQARSAAPAPPAVPGNIFAVIYIVGPKGGLFVYNPSAGPGNLVASIAGKSGTDKYGNAYVAGVASYGPLGAISQLYDGNVVVSQPGETGGGLFAEVSPGVTVIQPGADAGGTAMSLSLYSTTGSGQQQMVVAPAAGSVSAVTAELLEVQGGIGLVNGTEYSTITPASDDGHPIFSEEYELADISAGPAAPAAGVKAWAQAGRGYVMGSDTNVLNWGEARLIGTTEPQLIDSTGFTTIAGLSCELGVGTYEVEGKILFEGVAASAGNAEFQFNGSATLSAMHIDGYFKPNTGGNIATNGANASAFASTMESQTLSTTAQQVFQFEGVMTCSAAGTMHLDAACTVATDTYNIFGTRSYMNVKAAG